MAKINDIHSIIVPAQSPVFSAHAYTEIYGGTAGCTMVVNGVTVAVASSSNIALHVKTMSGGTGCYLLGEPLTAYGGGIANPQVG